jgi:hypothetical protein
MKPKKHSNKEKKMQLSVEKDVSKKEQRLL